MTRYPLTINRILAAILVLQIALIALVFWPRPAASQGESVLLLGELEAGDVVALTIEDTDGARIELRQTAGAWTLPHAGDYPAQEIEIAELLEKLAALDTGRLVTRTGASHKRLQVARDDFMRRIDLETAGGKSYTLYLGSSPSYEAAHVRLEGQDETCLVSGLSAWEVNATANSWVDTQYLSVPQDTITAIRLQNTNGELTLEKDAEGNWTLVGLAEDKELDSGSANALAGRVSSVTLLRPLGVEKESAYRMDQPQATVTIQTAEKTITLQVGTRFAQDGSYVVKSSESPYYVLVNEFSVQDLVEKTRDDFIQAPPTPAAEGGGP